MRLSSPDSAILAAVILNALIIVVLVPLALRGVRYRSVSADRMLRRHLAVYGLGGLIAPLRPHRTRRSDHLRRPRNRPTTMNTPVATVRLLGADLRALLVLTLLTGVVYPLAVTGWPSPASRRPRSPAGRTAPR
ncbi:hypothetical protein GCM10010145_18710 [Streptomyces ruber]|uniref:Uncharacterized protein n=2 Tax=Streptomyces TaxID=1883 RepID=A0A918B9Z3_9ACTN|nr:hypothetical protein GCM10010145_18710 [Streptomyces ruber]